MFETLIFWHRGRHCVAHQSKHINELLAVKDGHRSVWEREFNQTSERIVARIVGRPTACVGRSLEEASGRLKAWLDYEHAEEGEACTEAYLRFLALYFVEVDPCTV